MVRCIVITGTSKGIVRATADALVEGGWSVVGAARNSPADFPGVFIEVDLADREKTQDLAYDLIARGNVVGIVNNVGLARRERVDAVDPAIFAMSSAQAPMIVERVGAGCGWFTEALQQPAITRGQLVRLFLNSSPCEGVTVRGFLFDTGRAFSSDVRPRRNIALRRCASIRRNSNFADASPDSSDSPYSP